MTSPPFGPQWTVPPPPPSGDRPIRGAKVAVGMGLAALGQIAAIGLGVLVTVVLARSDDSSNALFGIYVEIALQLALFVACIVFGIVWIVRRDRGLGLGLLIGWAVSVLVFPVVGIGICIAVFSSGSGMS